MRSIDILEWDSTFFGIKIGRVALNSAPPDVLAKAVEAADLGGIQCLYWLVPCNDPLSLQAAQACGFRLVDIRITLETDLGEKPLDSFAAPYPDLQPVRLYVKEDLPAILTLARQSHRDSRFFFDGNFSEDKCAAMYAQWIQRGLTTRPDLIFVAGPHGQPTGYCVCDLWDDRTGNIGLIAVDPRWRETGLGTALVCAALRHFASAGMRWVTVVTQGRNMASQRLYQRCGFVTKSLQLWYHRWAGPTVRAT